jgi:hypothetical protein
MEFQHVKVADHAYLRLRKAGCPPSVFMKGSLPPFPSATRRIALSVLGPAIGSATNPRAGVEITWNLVAMGTSYSLGHPRRDLPQRQNTWAPP